MCGKICPCKIRLMLCSFTMGFENTGLIGWPNLYTTTIKLNRLIMKIQKKILPVIMATLLSLVFYQQASAQLGKSGIKGGLNMSNLYLDNVTDQNARLGFNIGVFGQLLSSEKFAIQPELLFSTKGTTAHYGGVINQQISYNLNYLDMPVLAVFKLGDVGEIHLGAYASYLLNANISYKGDLANGSDPIDKDNLKSFDYGISGGLGANFGKAQVGARYNFGVVEIADSNAARTVIGDAKNSCAQVYIAFALNSK
jgi:hypothetical protein